MTTNNYNEALGHRLWWSIIIASRSIAKARKKELLRNQVSEEESAILFIVSTADSQLSPSEISRIMVREPHSVSTLAARMEKRGLIKRNIDPKRKNIIRISLTRKGNKVCQELAKRESINRIMSILSQKEIKQLELIMGKLTTRAFEVAGIPFKINYPEK